MLITKLSNHPQASIGGLKFSNCDIMKVNSANSQGNSILFAALEKQSIRIIELLLMNSANPNFMCK